MAWDPLVDRAKQTAEWAAGLGAFLAAVWLGIRRVARREPEQRPDDTAACRAWHGSMLEEQRRNTDRLHARLDEQVAIWEEFRDQQARYSEKLAVLGEHIRQLEAHTGARKPRT